MTTPRLHGTSTSVPVGLLPGTGLRMSRVVLGTGPWVGLDEPRIAEMLRTYLEAGGFAVEVSDVDGGATETLLAKLVTRRVHRDKVLLIGRNGRGPRGVPVPGAVGDTSRRALVNALDSSLARLDVDNLDLWLVDGFDGVTPVEEIAATLEWAVTSGRATHVGVARVPAWQAVDLSHQLRARGIGLAAHAAEYSLLSREAEADVVPAAASRGHGVIAALPLAAGALSGKYRHGTPADSRRAQSIGTFDNRYLEAHARSVVESLSTAADGLGVHPSELALAWVLRRQGVDALTVGTRTAAQTRIALRAGDLVVPEEIMAALEEISGRS